MKRKGSGAANKSHKEGSPRKRNKTRLRGQLANKSGQTRRFVKKLVKGAARRIIGPGNGHPDFQTKDLYRER